MKHTDQSTRKKTPAYTQQILEVNDLMYRRICAQVSEAHTTSVVYELRALLIHEINLRESQKFNRALKTDILSVYINNIYTNIFKRRKARATVKLYMVKYNTKKMDN